MTYYPLRQITIPTLSPLEEETLLEGAARVYADALERALTEKEAQQRADTFYRDNVRRY